MPAYTVYTKPDCGQCDRSKDYFDAKGVSYEAIDITENPEAYEFITKTLGYSQAPVIVNNHAPDDHWSGLRRDKLVQAALNRPAALEAAS